MSDLIAVFLKNDEVLGEDVADQGTDLPTVDARNELKKIKFKALG